MQHSVRWVSVVPIVVGLPLAACNHEASHSQHEAPAHVEHIEGTNVSKVMLTDKAMERIDVQVSTVREQMMARSRAMRKVVPYAAVLYDADGSTWVYTRTESNTFVRAAITVDYIDGDVAVLSEGPPLGTEVVTVGGMELFGTEFEVGH